METRVEKLTHHRGIMNRNIRELEGQIESEKEIMSKCGHDFNEPFYNPETIREGYGSKMIQQGSDVWHEYAGYKDVEKPRWTRVCKICMYEQHTHEQKPIVSGHEPHFS